MTPTIEQSFVRQFEHDVAQRYASISYLKDVETRLTEHLLRIEAKLGQPARIGQ